MKSVNLNRKQLLDIVIDNLAKHQAQYDEAVIDYKTAVLVLMENNIELARSQDLTQFTKINPIPMPPVSYETNYIKAIRMLELSVDDELEIDEQTFNQLVLDEWSWKNNFNFSSQLYKSIVG